MAPVIVGRSLPLDLPWISRMSAWSLARCDRDRSHSHCELRKVHACTKYVMGRHRTPTTGRCTCCGPYSNSIQGEGNGEGSASIVASVRPTPIRSVRLSWTWDEFKYVIYGRLPSAADRASCSCSGLTWRIFDVILTYMGPAPAGPAVRSSSIHHHELGLAGPSWQIKVR